MNDNNRAANAMSEEHKFAHAMLERWASWAKDALLTPWPRQTVLSRVMKLGPDGAAARGFLSVEPPQDIAVIDRVVARLPLRSAAVIRKYYLEWKPPADMAAEMGMKPWEFSHQLRLARSQVSYELQGVGADIDIYRLVFISHR